MEKSSSLKCRKCRLLLVEEKAGRLEASVEASSGGEGANVYSLFEDQLPQWISDAIEEVRHQEGLLDRLQVKHKRRLCKFD